MSSRPSRDLRQRQVGEGITALLLSGAVRRPAAGAVSTEKRSPYRRCPKSVGLVSTAVTADLPGPTRCSRGGNAAETFHACKSRLRLLLAVPSPSLRLLAAKKSKAGQAELKTTKRHLSFSAPSGSCSQQTAGKNFGCCRVGVGVSLLFGETGPVGGSVSAVSPRPPAAPPARSCWDPVVVARSGHPSLGAGGGPVLALP